MFVFVIAAWRRDARRRDVRLFVVDRGDVHVEIPSARRKFAVARRRFVARATRDERVVVRTGVVVALRAAIMSLGVVCLSETGVRVRLEEVTSVRSRVDRTRRNVRVTNARVRVCGTSVEETSTPSTPSIATASTPSRSRRDDEPSTVGRERTRVPSPLVVLRGLVRESRPIKKTHTQTDRPRSRSFETQGRDGSWWHHP